MINQLWKQIIKTSKNLKQENENFDGLNFWKSFKPQLIEINKKISKKIIWNYQSHDALRNNFSHFINDISVDRDVNGNLIEWKHFIRQILWIPHKDEGKFSFHRLMQIALNYGQLLGSLDKVPEGIKQILNKEYLFLEDITKYISQENLNEINLTEEEFNSIKDILEGYESAVDITQTENITTDVVTTEADEDVTTAHMADTIEGESSEDVLSSDVVQNGGHKRYYINYQ